MLKWPRSSPNGLPSIPPIGCLYNGYSTPITCSFFSGGLHAGAGQILVSFSQCVVLPTKKILRKGGCPGFELQDKSHDLLKLSLPKHQYEYAQLTRDHYAINAGSDFGHCVWSVLETCLLPRACLRRSLRHRSNNHHSTTEAL